MSAKALRRKAMKSIGSMNGILAKWAYSSIASRYRREWGLKKGLRRARRRIGKELCKDYS